MNIIVHAYQKPIIAMRQTMLCLLLIFLASALVACTGDAVAEPATSVPTNTPIPTPTPEPATAISDDYMPTCPICPTYSPQAKSKLLTGYNPGQQFVQVIQLLRYFCYIFVKTIT